MAFAAAERVESFLFTAGPCGVGHGIQEVEAGIEGTAGQGRDGYPTGTEDEHNSVPCPAGAGMEVEQGKIAAAGIRQAL